MMIHVDDDDDDDSFMMMMIHDDDDDDDVRLTTVGQPNGPMDDQY